MLSPCSYDKLETKRHHWLQWENNTVNSMKFLKSIYLALFVHHLHITTKANNPYSDSKFNCANVNNCTVDTICKHNYMYSCKKIRHPDNNDQLLLLRIITTRGPRGPWNAHLRLRVFKSTLFIALYTTGDTWGSKSEVMFEKNFLKFDLVT